MDTRFPPSSENTTREFQVFFHNLSDITDVRKGISTDGVDWSPWVSGGSQSPSQLSVTLSWYNEFLGAAQPQPGQVLELRSLGIPLWIGYINAISTYTVSFGVRQMTVTATSRETWDIWKLSKRVTALYPLMTNLNQIITDVAINVGLDPDEIIMPPNSLATVHSNTQLSNISAWEMVQTVCAGLGVTPLINGVGQLTAVSRDVQVWNPTYVLSEYDVVKVNGSRNRPSTTRYVLTWSDPNLSQVLQSERLLAQVSMTPNFFVPYLYHDVYYSPDKTQRATGITRLTRVSCDYGIPLLFNEHDVVVDSDTKCRLVIFSYGIGFVVAAWFALIIATSAFDWIPFVGVGSGVAVVGMFLLNMTITTGQYEVWGTPFDWAHAKNTSEAYDASAVPWLDNPQEAECDFIINEAHAQATCTRELIYLSKAANTWSATINENLQMERGDIVEFPDGTGMYVLDFNRDISRGSPNVLSVSGFLLTGTVGNNTVVVSPTPVLATMTINKPIVFQLFSGTAPNCFVVVVSSPSSDFAGFALHFSGDGINYSGTLSNTGITALTWAALYGNPAVGGNDGLNLVPASMSSINFNLTQNWRLGSAVTGSLTTDFPAAADPDTTDTVTVSTVESNGMLGDGSQCYVASDTGQLVSVGVLGVEITIGPADGSGLYSPDSFGIVYSPQSVQGLMFNSHPCNSPGYTSIFPGDPHTNGNQPNPQGLMVSNIVGSNGTYLGDEPILHALYGKGNGLGCFNAVITGTFTIQTAGMVAFSAYMNSAFVIGVAGATYVSGLQSFGSLSGGTATKNYPPLAGLNDPGVYTETNVGGAGWDQVNFTLNFPVSGPYLFEINFASGLFQETQFCLLANGAVIPAQLPIGVYGGQIIVGPADGTGVFNLPPDGYATPPIVARPILITNGWGNNAQAGPYECTNVAQSIGWCVNNAITYPYVLPVGGAVGEWTPSSFGANHYHTYAGCIYSFDIPQFQSLGGPQLWLNVLSEVPPSTPAVPVTTRSAGIWYSLDAGVTWLNLYNSANKPLGWNCVQLPVPLPQALPPVPSTSGTLVPVSVYGVEITIGPADGSGLYNLTEFGTTYAPQAIQGLMLNTSVGLFEGDPHGTGNQPNSQGLMVSNIVGPTGAYLGDEPILNALFGKGNGVGHFNAVLTGWFTVQTPGDVNFSAYVNSAFVIGIAGASYVSGLQDFGSLSGGTATMHYPSLAGMNNPGDYDVYYKQNGTNPLISTYCRIEFTIHFPFAGNYPFEINYASGLFQESQFCLFGNLLVIPTQPLIVGQPPPKLGFEMNDVRVMCFTDVHDDMTQNILDINVALTNFCTTNGTVPGTWGPLNPPQSIQGLIFNAATTNGQGTPYILPSDPHTHGNQAFPFVNNMTGIDGEYEGDNYIAGTGTKANFPFNAVITGQFTIATACSITFTAYVNSAFAMGIKNAAWVSGLQHFGELSGGTYLKGYPMLVGINTVPDYDALHGGLDWVIFNFTISFPTGGNYPFEIDYASGLFTEREFCLLANGEIIPWVPTLNTIATYGGAPLPYELITFDQQQTTGTNQYALSGSIGRDQQGAPYLTSGEGVDHPAGSRFAWLNGMGAETMPPGIYIGGPLLGFGTNGAAYPLFVKACALDVYGAEHAEISAVTQFSAIPFADAVVGAIDCTVNVPGVTIPFQVPVKVGTGNIGVISYWSRAFAIPAPTVATTYYVWMIDLHYLGDGLPSSFGAGAIVSPGSGYKVGDTGTINPVYAALADPAIYEVTSANSAGQVTGLQINWGGNGYALTPGSLGFPPLATVVGNEQPGVGAGLVLNCTLVNQGMEFGSAGLWVAPNLVGILSTTNDYIGERGYIFMGSITVLPGGGGAAAAGEDDLGLHPAPCLSQPNPTTILMAPANTVGGWPVPWTPGDHVAASV